MSAEVGRVGDAPAAFAAERRAVIARAWATVLGIGALVACVCCSAWTAIAVADGRYLLELPSGAAPTGSTAH